MHPSCAGRSRRHRTHAFGHWVTRFLCIVGGHLHPYVLLADLSDPLDWDDDVALEEKPSFDDEAGHLAIWGYEDLRDRANLSSVRGNHLGAMADHIVLSRHIRFHRYRGVRGNRWHEEVGCGLIDRLPAGNRSCRQDGTRKARTERVEQMALRVFGRHFDECLTDEGRQICGFIGIDPEVNTV